MRRETTRLRRRWRARPRHRALAEIGRYRRPPFRDEPAPTRWIGAQGRCAWENAMVFLGIDVSKGRLDCAVLATEGGRSPGRRSFRNDAEGAERAATWTAQVSGAAAAATHVILEATAAYHEPVAHRLAALGMRVSIVNPAQVRSFA